MATLRTVRIAPATKENLQEEERKDPLLKKVVTGDLNANLNLSDIVSLDTTRLRFSSNSRIGSLFRAFSEWSMKNMETSLSLSWLKSKN